MGQNWRHRVHMLTFYKSWLFFSLSLFCIVLFQIKTLTHMTFLSHFGYTWRHADGAGAAMECRAAQPSFARQPARVLVASSSMGISDREVLDYLSSSLEMLCSLHWAPSCGRKTATIPHLSHLKWLGHFCSALWCWGTLPEFPPAILGCLGFGGFQELQR